MAKTKEVPRCDLAKLRQDFEIQTRKPLAGRTRPVVSWFGSPEEAKAILAALASLET